MQDSQRMIVCFLSSKNFPRSPEHEILVSPRIIRVWKNDKKSIVDECASHVTIFVQALLSTAFCSKLSTDTCQQTALTFLTKIKLICYNTLSSSVSFSL